MPKLNPNEVVIKAAIARGDRAVYSIAKYPGLYLATSSVMVGDEKVGRGSWRMKYRPVGSKHQRWITITNDARGMSFREVGEKAREMQTALRVNGTDPKIERQAAIAAAKVQGLTFDTLFNDWLERHSKVKKRSWKKDLNQYNCHLKDSLGRELVVDIHRRRIIAGLSDIAKASTGIVANRVQAMISAVFSWALSTGVVEQHPALRIPKLGLERVRERVLTHAELRKIWNALGSIVSGTREGPMTPQMAQLLKVLMLTGARRSEVAHAATDEIANGLWTLPAARMKNKRPHTVPLAPTVAKIIADAMLKSAPSRLVFPGSAGGLIEPASVQRALTRLLKTLDIENVRPHDLRRTMASEMGRMGVPEETISRALAHARTGVTARHYNLHSYDPEKLKALRLWQAQIRNVASGRRQRVLKWRA
jgi:integrase